MSGLTATANPLVYTATFTAADGFAGAGSVAVTAGGYADAAGNPGAAGSDTVAIDRSNPTVAVDIDASLLSDSTPSATVSFTFSEAPDGFTLADIVTTVGTVSGLTATADPLVYTATFTATPDVIGTGSVTVAAGSYSDGAGNPGELGSDTVTVDRAADADDNMTLTIPDTTINAAESTQVGFVVSGIDPDVVSTTVTFTDSAGHTVTVDASDGVADLSSFVSGRGPVGAQFPRRPWQHSHGRRRADRPR